MHCSCRLHSRGSQHLKAMAEVDHLAAERATARFDVEEMKVAWAGSRHAVHVADRMARLVASDPVSRPIPLVLDLAGALPPAPASVTL